MLEKFKRKIFKFGKEFYTTPSLFELDYPRSSYSKKRSFNIIKSLLFAEDNILLSRRLGRQVPKEK
jgi:hypothetical protein